jgi:hypothetical protein
MSVFDMPAMYPARTIKRKKRLFPLAVLDLHDFTIDMGHAAAKHTSMTTSRIFAASNKNAFFRQVFYLYPLV